MPGPNFKEDEDRRSSPSEPAPRRKRTATPAAPIRSRAEIEKFWNDYHSLQKQQMDEFKEKQAREYLQDFGHSDINNAFGKVFGYDADTLSANARYINKRDAEQAQSDARLKNAVMSPVRNVAATTQSVAAPINTDELIRLARAAGTLK